jgi:hypothetical protein
MRRERRNEEKPIQPFVKTNNDNNHVEYVMGEEYLIINKNPTCSKMKMMLSI